MKKQAALLLGVVMLALSGTASAGAEEAPSCALSVGTTEIHVLSLVRRDLKAAILQPATAQQKEAVARAYPEGAVHNSLNVLLLRGNGVLALVDTGYDWTTAELDAALQRAGVTTRDITHVILTHAHGDHVGGLIRDGKPTFPQAKILFSRKELAYWTNPANKAAAPEGIRRIFSDVEAVRRLYGERVSAFDAGGPVCAELPDVQAVDEAGHTPGHVGIMATANGKTFLFWADLLHAFDVQTAFPAVSSSYDMDPEAAARVRAELLDRARAGGWLVTGAHVPFVRPRAL